MMRVFFAFFLAFSVLVPSDAAVAADEAWTGFWRLEQKSEKNSPIFVLWIPSTGRPHLFDHEWNDVQLASGSGWEGDSLEISQYFKGGQIVWSGRRDGDALEGEWKFLHIQYSSKGSFSGTRESPVALSDWNPLEAVNASTSEHGVLNLTAILHEAAGDEAGFREYWENTFLPGFLPLLPDFPDRSVAWAALQKDGELAV